ncbi:hypothetical protein JEQ21_04345 [Streptococcus sp. 121]|uniref:TcaA second domain-containing protein n=1 Tax=Streptococcus sp. 121 TaxID=2797637 RepID=UPI0018F07671|nr:hypothetical protein [Streptococcus sp. 121]MBJ6745702.1 hypothetical protein [Streptococcus sp. 121]
MTQGSNSRWNRKKQAQLTGLAIVGLALGTGAYVVQATGPDAAIRSFSQAVQAEDYEKVAKLLSTPSSKWTSKDAQGFVGYLEDNGLKVEDILEQLKDQKAGAKVYQDAGGNKILGLVEDSKTLFFFDTYRVSSYPVAVQVTSNLEALTIDGQTVPKNQATDLGRVKLTNQPLALLASTEFGRLDTNLLLPFDKAKSNQLEMDLTAVEKELVATLPGQSSDYFQVKLMVNGKKVADGLSKKLLLLEEQKLEIHASFYYMGKEFTTESKTVEVSATSDQVEVALDLGASVKSAMKEAQVQASEEAKAAAAASVSASQSRERAAQASASQSKEAEARKSSSTSNSSSSSTTSSTSSSSSGEEETQTSTSSSVKEGVVLDSIPTNLIGRWQTEDGFLELNADGSGQIQLNGRTARFQISQLQDQGQGVYQILEGDQVWNVISPESWMIDGGQDVAIGLRLKDGRLETLRWVQDRGPVSDFSQITASQRYQRQSKEGTSASSGEASSSSAVTAESSVEQSTSSTSSSSASPSTASNQEERDTSSSSYISSSSQASETETSTTSSNQGSNQEVQWSNQKHQALQSYLDSLDSGNYTWVTPSTLEATDSKKVDLVFEDGQTLSDQDQILDIFDYRANEGDSTFRYFFIKKEDGSVQILRSQNLQGPNYQVEVVSDKPLTHLFEELIKK